MASDSKYEVMREWARALGKAARKSAQEEYDKMGIPKGHPMRKIAPITIVGGGKATKIEGGSL